jgi:(p)ppGpp synthase/HD superfamily hydrolase
VLSDLELNKRRSKNMASIEKALQIAAKAHEGQKDKEGLPYILHPLRVMQRVEGEQAQIVAVLHDVIEDTAVTADDLRQAGFSEQIIAGVLCVTHRNDETYADYVVRCKANEVARKVKLADLEDNSRLDRTILRPQRFQADVARIRKYLLSYKFLVDHITEEQYRTLMECEP